MAVVVFIIFILILGGIVGGLYYGLKTGFIRNDYFANKFGLKTDPYYYVSGQKTEKYITLTVIDFNSPLDPNKTLNYKDKSIRLYYNDNKKILGIGVSKDWPLSPVYSSSNLFLKDYLYLKERPSLENQYYLVPSKDADFSGQLDRISASQMIAFKLPTIQSILDKNLNDGQELPSSGPNDQVVFVQHMSAPSGATEEEIVKSTGATSLRVSVSQN